jgi:ribose transport system ATP-binding protein
VHQISQGWKVMVVSDEQVPNVAVLQMRGIRKTFGAVRALSGVDLTARRGEVLALMGENGAGKSTLMKILSGAYTADPGGEILIDGQPVSIGSPTDAKRLGIAVIYQELALAPQLSVAENIFLGREPRRFGMVDRVAMLEGSVEVLRRLGARFTAASKVGSLSVAERQLVEIARAVHAKARILVMDEPTAALSSHETERLFALIQQLRGEGLAIIYISHRMAEIYALADRVSVLRDGAYVGTLERTELSEQALVKMMVGRDPSSFYKKPSSGAGKPPGATFFEVVDMADGRRVHGCSFGLRRGEVLGLAGLVGSGRTELARLIFGIDTPTAGTLTLDGKPLLLRTPEQAIAAGVLYLTEDRKGDGLFLDMSVEENINFMVYGDDARVGALDRGAARRRVEQAIGAFNIRVAGRQAKVGALSGGNQQKVLLARLIEARPRVLILDEPTRGVDIGAKSEIYKIIDQLAGEGIGIVLISSELAEVVGLCDRVLVMRDGLLAGEVGGDGQPIEQEAIIRIATGATAQAV